MDKKAIIKALRDTAQSASNSIASNVSGPVDLLAAGLRGVGLPIPQNAFGGSQWMADKGLTREVEMGAPRIIGETLGMAGPAIATAKAPQIAAGMNQMVDNAMAPAAMNNQAGMIRIAGRGQIPETRGDVNKLSDRFQRLLDDAGVNYTHDKSGLSPARYFEFDNPKTLADEYGPERFKVRISDHRNVHGADISVDPATGGTFEEMLKSVRDIGIPVASKVKPTSKTIVPDAVLERILGKPIAEISEAWVKNQRENLVFDKKQGFWRNK